MNMEELLEQLDEALDSGVKLLGKKSVVDVDKIRAIVDDIRMAMPNEIKQAKGICADRADIISNAKKEAESIKRAAEERANQLTSQEEVTKLANARAKEIITNAQIKSKEMRKAAQDFVDDIMRRADDGLTANLADVRKTRAALRQQAPATPVTEEAAAE